MCFCKDCLHSKKYQDDYEQFERNIYQCECPKIKYGYGYWIKDVGIDGALIENDEGWGMFVGENFGCVHFELNK